MCAALYLGILLVNIVLERLTVVWLHWLSLNIQIDIGTKHTEGELRLHTNTHLAQLLMDTQVVHHYDPINNLQQGLLCDWLVWLFQRSPQQQAIVAMATLNLKIKEGGGEERRYKRENGEIKGGLIKQRFQRACLSGVVVRGAGSNQTPGYRGVRCNPLTHFFSTFST